jgi:P pilus assembly chaperone PapD
MFKLLTVFLLLCSANASAKFEISEKRIFFFSRDNSSAFTLVNSGTQPQEYVLSTQHWGHQAINQVADLIAYPPVFTLGPGEKQRVRLLLRDKDNLKPPIFFRLRLREQVPNETLNNTQLPTVFSFPVYYVDHDAKASLRLAIAYEARTGKPAKAIVNNNSNTVAHITAVRNGRNEVAPLGLVLRSEETYDFLLGDTPLPISFQLKNGAWYTETGDVAKRNTP